jgi:hypothetical protein
LAHRRPLEAAHLRSIEDCLSDGDLDQAQRLLAQVGSSDDDTAGTSYLATRLLYLRERLDPQSVAERLSELLVSHPNFPEAHDLLRLANQGVRGSQSLPPPPPMGSAPMSERLTEQPPQWPPEELQRALDAPPDSQRPTALPAQVQNDVIPNQLDDPTWITVDTRAHSVPPKTRPPPLSQPPPGRLDTTYAVRLSLPPPLLRKPPPLAAPSHDSVTPLSSKVPSSPRIGSHPRAVAPPTSGSSPDQEPFSASTSSNSFRSSSVTSTVPPSMRPLPPLSDAHQLWPVVELQLFQGDSSPALEHLALAARQQLSHLPPTDTASEFEILGSNAAELLNKSWVTHHFAPFDLSMQSLSRLEAAMATLCRMQPMAEPASPLLLLLGSYVGEVIRISHRGAWVGSATAARIARVSAGSLSWQPFQSVRHWLMAGGRTSLFGELGAGLARPGTVAWQAFRPTKVTPHTLWQGEAEPSSMPILGRALQDSVLSLCCELLHDRPLDGSLESLDPLDRVLSTIVSSAQPLGGQEPWLQRIGLLGGAYLGEVLNYAVGAEWQEGGESPSAFILRMTGGREAMPCAHIISRTVTQRPLDLELFANISLGRAG